MQLCCLNGDLAAVDNMHMFVTSAYVHDALHACKAGEVCIGLDAQQLEHIARSGAAVRKV